MKDHLQNLLNFAVGSLNKWGYNRISGKSIQTFTPEEKFRNLFLKENDKIFESKLNSYLVDTSHVLSYKKRSVWEEFPYTSIESFFPVLTEREIDSFTTGIFSLRKAKKYKKNVLSVLKERSNYLVQKNSTDQTTNTSLNSKIYRTMKLKPEICKLYLNCDVCIRVDIPSYFGSSRKFIAAIAIKKVENEYMFSFACTCSTGSRFSPCAHNSLNLYLFGFFLKQNVQ